MGSGYDRVSNRDKIRVFLPGLGKINRDFRSRGEAISYLQRHYGQDYQKLRPSFTHVSFPNLFEKVYGE